MQPQGSLGYPPAQVPGAGGYYGAPVSAASQQSGVYGAPLPGAPGAGPPVNKHLAAAYQQQSNLLRSNSAM